jgi:hypothetical protein
MRSYRKCRGTGLHRLQNPWSCLQTAHRWVVGCKSYTQVRERARQLVYLHERLIIKKGNFYTVFAERFEL